MILYLKYKATSEDVALLVCRKIILLNNIIYVKIKADTFYTEVP